MTTLGRRGLLATVVLKINISVAQLLSYNKIWILHISKKKTISVLTVVRIKRPIAFSFFPFKKPVETAALSCQMLHLRYRKSRRFYFKRDSTKVQLRLHDEVALDMVALSITTPGPQWGREGGAIKTHRNTDTKIKKQLR